MSLINEELKRQQPQMMGQENIQGGVGTQDTLSRITEFLRVIEKILNSPMGQRLANKTTRNKQPARQTRPPLKGQAPSERGNANTPTNKGKGISNIDKEQLLINFLESPNAEEELKGFVDMLIKTVGDVKLSELKEAVPKLIKTMKKIKGVNKDEESNKTE